MTRAGALLAAEGARWNALRVLPVLAALMLLPAAFGHGYYLNTLNFVAVLALPAIGLSLLSGLCGQLAISHGAFFAIGAYGSSILATRAGLSAIAATLLAQVIVALVAAAIGAVVLRLRSHYLAIATLSFAIIVEVVAKEWSSVTGGQQGMTGIPAYRLGSLALHSDASFYYAYWPVTMLLMWFALNLAHSRVGRVLRAIREGEPVVDSLGIGAARHKATIYVVSSLFAGLGGSMYAHFVGFVTPATGSIMFAIDIIMVLALGGFDRLWGALIGVALITVLNEYALGFADYKRIILGAGLVAVMLVFPRGLLPGLLGLAQRRFEGRRR